jgi:hypothetical protein
VWNSTLHFAGVLFAEGNTTTRYYGPPGYPFLKIGGGILYAIVFEVVKSACVVVGGSDNQIKKSIRDGLNTIRLHHQAVEARMLRQQQLRADHEDEASESDASLPQYICQTEDTDDDA